MAARTGDVAGLDVAVDDAFAVRVVQGVGHLACDPDRLVDGEPTLAGKRP